MEGINKSEKPKINEGLKNDQEILSVYNEEYKKLEDIIIPLDKIVFDEPDIDNVELHNEWSNKMDERSLLEIKINDLDTKILSVKEYNSRLEMCNSELNKLINMAENYTPDVGSSNILNHLGRLHDINLFLEVCAQKDLNDFNLLKEKKEVLINLINPLIEESKTRTRIGKKIKE